jgi:hypothetical protein
MKPELKSEYDAGRSSNKENSRYEERDHFKRRSPYHQRHYSSKISQNLKNMVNKIFFLNHDKSLILTFYFFFKIVCSNKGSTTSSFSNAGIAKPQPITQRKVLNDITISRQQQNNNIRLASSRGLLPTPEKLKSGGDSEITKPSLLLQTRSEPQNSPAIFQDSVALLSKEEVDNIVLSAHERLTSDSLRIKNAIDTPVTVGFVTEFARAFAKEFCSNFYQELMIHLKQSTLSGKTE